jgi:outer membrane receptor protein involved in Fe transport
MKRCVFVCAAALVAAADTSFAQAREPIGRFVLDLRAASAGLPAIEGWTPTVPENTQVPARALGFEAGGHFHFLRLPGITLGIGATYLTAKGTSSPPDLPAGTPQTIPEVTTRLRSLAPQLSMNFGHSLGWSYLSVGLGRTRVESEASSVEGIAFTPRDSDWVKTLNFGGGARWFINEHVGVGFDLRWHKLSVVPTTSTHPGAPRATLFMGGAGLVLK